MVERYLEAAVNAAKAAGKLQRSRFGSGYRVDYKGEKNLVTEVDRASEELIIDALRTVCPGCDILAEESGLVSNGSEMRWIVDPLDGTTNYAHGFPWFAVSIALEIAGAVRLGVVYHPMMDELFTALAGEGARLNGQRIRVSSRQPLKECLLATGFPYDRTRTNENNFRNFEEFQLAARAVRRAGAAALDLAYVAAGRLDGYWECKLNPWDVAAGRLLVEESEGAVTDFRGDPHRITDHRILASNGLIHREMVDVLAARDTAPSA